MLRNYFKTALRSLTKKKLFSFINIFGLAIGLAAFLIIYQFVSFERSFDKFHEKGDRIYRVRFDRIYADNHDKSAGLTAVTGPILAQEFPEVELYSKLHAADYMNNVISFDDKQFIQEGLFYADSSFFELFSFNFIHGDKKTALTPINSIVLSEEVAYNYFGKADVVGEFLNLANGWENQLYQVTGVFENLPPNTHFDFKALMSFENINQASQGRAGASGGWNAFPTYLLLSPEADLKEFNEKLTAFTQEFYAALIEGGVNPILQLQPLEDIYLTSNLRFEVGPLGDAKIVRILIGIASFILVLAYFNYINLSTSQALERGQEVGVRKVIGASRWNLFRQFLVESFVLNVIAIAIGFTLMQVSLPFFLPLLGKDIGSAPVLTNELGLLLAMLLTIGTLLSGFYPALVMSRMKALRVLKGFKAKSGLEALVKKGLVVLQFTILCFLLVGSLVVRSQISFMLNSDKGFDAEQVLVIKGPTAGANSIEKLNSFKNRLTNNKNVVQVSNSTNVPGAEISWVNNNVRLATSAPNEATSIPFLGIDHNFIENLSLEMIAGRNFDQDLVSDTANVMLSRAAAVNFGFTDPKEALDQLVFEGDSRYRVIGVVENYLQKSFKSDYDRIIYKYFPQADSYINLKLTGTDYATLIDSVESIFKESYPNSPFSYFFLDEFFDRQLKEDKAFGKIFNFFTLLGICISCLGLFGLASYAVSLRKKEIGIRKVLGAHSVSLVISVARNFVGLTVISILIAIPVAFYASDLWLNAYTFAISLKAYMFLIPVLIVIAITVFTTGGIAIKTANRNPIDALRQE
ncbi:ABC transporter permease [Roseivirga misakiensis]|uniref:ABC transporter permease n=1 Tax=Roseivirga misakiensis TaxID=1563681 RepID=A0A1E5SZH9_9BACT|nr:ABC transporter permease [Roseivirga misakiensis]OEK04519.1 hypothetical protein BFP71_13710 [Roseivirga misakiensis]